MRIICIAKSTKSVYFRVFFRPFMNPYVTFFKKKFNADSVSNKIIQIER